MLKSLDAEIFEDWCVYWSIFEFIVSCALLTVAPTAMPAEINPIVPPMIAPAVPNPAPVNAPLRANAKLADVDAAVPNPPKTDDATA